MAQPVSLKLDTAVSKAPAADKTATTDDQQAFTKAFEREVSRDNPRSDAPETSQNSAKPTATAPSREVEQTTNKSAEAEKIDPSDGNSLPPGDDVTHEKNIETNQNQQVVIATPLAENIIAAVDNIAIDQTASAEEWFEMLQLELEKSGVSLSEAEIELLKQTVVPAVASSPVKLLPITEKTLRNTLLETASLSETTALKTLTTLTNGKDENALTPSVIRADILQALKKQTVEVSNESQQTLKNIVHSLTQNADAKLPTVNVTEVMRQLQGGTATPERAANVPVVTTAAPLSVNTSGGTAAAPAIALDVQPGLNQPNWSRVVSSRVVYMANEGIQRAELRLNPAQLGPVEVRLSIINDQTNVTFLANNATTREALEQALPRLRESFADNGLALNNTQVGQQDQSDHRQQDERFTAQEGRISQVSVELDDNEIEAPVLHQDDPEGGHGVSLYA